MKTLIVAIALLGLESQLFAQEFPTPKPTDAHKVLVDDAGTWDCKGKMFLQGPEGTPLEFKGVETNRMVSGGLYATSDFNAEFGGAPFEGHGLMGFDPRTEEYTGTWVDNFTSVPAAMKGKYDAKAKTMTMRSTVVDIASGEEMKQKQVTTYTGDGAKKFEIFLVVEIDGRETDIKLMEMTATKRK